MTKSLFHRLSRVRSSYARDTAGSMAIEFAIVVVPFVTILFGTIAVGLYFFVTFSLENAVEQASRQIRTGQAQLASKTKSQFKGDVCAKAPSFIDCTSSLRVDVIQFADFAAADPPSCTDGSGNLIPDPTNDPVPGDAGEVVLIVVCYEWKLAAAMPFLNLGNMGNGSAMIQAATTFRTEPYS
ncbi:MAG: TadE/TadG family type IV pilus assembly protein [Hyphomicrobiaceae bacterium]